MNYRPLHWLRSPGWGSTCSSNDLQHRPKMLSKQSMAGNPSWGSPRARLYRNYS